MESFSRFRARKIMETGQDGVAPGLGQLSGTPDVGASPGDDAKSAYRDLEASIQAALGGPSGRAVISGIIQVVMSDPQVPDRVKTDLQSKISTKWSHLIDTGEKPVKIGGEDTAPVLPSRIGNSPVATF